MKSGPMKLVGGILLGGAALLAALPACGGSTGGTTPVPVTPQATATSQPTAEVAPAATATPQAIRPTPTAAVAPAPTTPLTSPSNTDLLAQGKLIFEKTAGGVGCAACHGLDGKGMASTGAPANRGASEAQVRAALISLEAMSFIKLRDEEITAVAAYLQWLATQP